MTTAVNTTNLMMAPPQAAVTSTVELSTYLAAPPERVWAALRNFDSKSTAGLLKVLYQKTNRELVYAVSGLPRIVSNMIGQVELRPDGAGTRLHWSLHFSTKPTLIARLFRPLMRAGIARTLREAAQRFQAAMAQ
jgi:carbon monoxide dehydrogenase subunit G